MKLVELLARELDVWADTTACYVQDKNGDVWPFRSKPVNIGGDWSCRKGASIDQSSRAKHLPAAKLATDHANAIVTRAAWDAERARIAKPAEAKWIRHRGGKCPVEAGVVIEYRERNGDIYIEDNPRLLDTMWIHDGTEHDIMAFRICEPVQRPEPEPLSVDEWMAAIVKKDGPIQWRDRIRAIDIDIAAQNEAHRLAIETLEEERVSLVRRLAEEGLQLVGVAAVNIEDMSDSKNWKAGDIIQCLDSFSGQFTEGSLYRVRGEVIGSRVRVEVDDDNQENGWHADHFKFRSRPTA